MLIRWGPRTVASAVGRGRGAIGGFGGHVADVQVMAGLKTLLTRLSDMVGQEDDSIASLSRYVFCRSDACPSLPHNCSVIQSGSSCLYLFPAFGYCD